MITIFLGIASALALPGGDAPWQPLSDKPVPISCIEDRGGPWCRAQGLISAPPAKVATALERMSESADLFESVVRIDVIAPDTLRIVLDYPWPFDDRDYVAKYTREVSGEVRRYKWTPAGSSVFPPEDGIVRLPRFAGEWKLEPAPGGTLVTYTWHADPAGSIPKKGHTTARKKAGHHALKDLARTQNATLSVPAAASSTPTENAE